MTAAATRPRTVVPLPSPAHPDRVAGAGLRWLYGLVLLTLLGTGAGAGQAVYTVVGLERFRWAATCLHVYGLDDVPGVEAAGRAGDWAFCVDRYNAGQGVAMLAGAAATLALAWLCMLAGALVVGRRVRRARSAGPAAELIAARFAFWCRETGLDGPRRPRLAVVRPVRRLGQAFTTARPFGRPVVVVPSGHAYLPDGHLDLVLLHELAHARVRDLGWAAATWWAGWLNAPVLLAALVPVLLHPEPLAHTFRAAAGNAVALSVATIVLRAAVLRRREQSADRYAVVRGGCHPALHDAGRRFPAARHDEPAGVPPGATGTARSAVRGLLRRVFATHPPGPQRAARAMREDGGWEAGALVALAAGLLAMFTFQWADTLVLDLLGSDTGDPRLPFALALVAAALAWAATVVPVWARSRSAGRSAGWWRAAGSAAGLVAGSYLQPAGTLVAVGLIVAGGDLWRALLCSALPLAGVSVLAVELAAAAGAVRGRRRRVLATGAAVLGSATALATAAGAILLLLPEYGTFRDGAAIRAAFTLQGASWWWRWTPLLLLAAAGILAVAAPGLRAGLRRAGPLVAVGALVGGAVGVVHSRLRIGGVVDESHQALLVEQRWWICALAGAGVAAAVLVRARARLPLALLAGAAAAVGAGLLQYGRDLVAGRSGHGLANLAGFARMPVWLMVASLIVLLPLVRLADTWPGRRRVRGPALLVAGALVLPVLVAAGVLAPVTGRLGDDRHLRIVTEATRRPELLPAWASPVSAPEPAERAGRVRTDAELAELLRRVTHGYPAVWTVQPEDEAADIADLADPQPASCAARLAADRAAERARTIEGSGRVALGGPPPEGVSVTVAAESAEDPAVGWALLNEDAAERADCREWTVADGRSDDGRRHVRLTELPPPALRYPGVREHLTVTIHYRGLPLPRAVSTGQVMVGHTTVTVTASLVAPMREAPTAAQWSLLDTMVDRTLRAAVDRLASGPGTD